MSVPLPVRVVPSLTLSAWLTPPPLGLPTAVRDREELAGLDRCHFGGVPAIELGRGPLALALHGWGGRPAQMVPVARRLADDGYHVVVPELPGHAGGAPTDIKQAAAAVRSITRELGSPELVVAHSFAAMVLRLAFPDVGPPMVVLVAPALDVRDALDTFSNHLRLLPWARRGLTRRLEAWDPALWPAVSQILPGQLPGSRILIVHDPADRETPFARSAELAAIRAGTSIVAVEGAGHTRVLRSTVLLDATSDFVLAEAESAA